MTANHRSEAHQGAPQGPNRAARRALARQRKRALARQRKRVEATGAPSGRDAHAARDTVPRTRAGAAPARRFDGHSRHRG